MGEIDVAIKGFGDRRRSALLDDFERLSIQSQLNQAMLRRSLSEPGTSMFDTRLGVGMPPLVQQPVKQGKRGSAWGSGLHKMVKKLLRPVFWKKKSSRNDDQEQHCQHKPNSKDLKYLRRFSKSVRHY